MHNHVRDDLCSTAARAHVAPLREELAHLPGEAGLHADIMLSFLAGRPQHNNSVKSAGWTG